MGLVEKIRVSFYIEHPNVSDMDVRLQAPGETMISRSIAISDTGGANYGSGTADASRTMLDDTTSGDIQTAASPRVGTFLSRNGDGLDAFATEGFTAEGTWSLIVRDFEPGNTGILHAASMFLTVGGVETRYDAAGLPMAIPDEDPDGIVVPFELAPPPPPELPPATPGASFVCTLLPNKLLKGASNPGSEELDEVIDDEHFVGLVELTEDDAVAVEQFWDVSVKHPLNDGRTGGFAVSMHDRVLGEAGVLGALEPWEGAIRIAYHRPGAVAAEDIFCGQTSVIDRYTTGFVVLAAESPMAKLNDAQVRIGDAALNIDHNRGELPMHAESLDVLIDCARNTPDQNLRGMPGLGMTVDLRGTLFGDPDDAGLVRYDRGQIVKPLTQQIIGAAGGPDVDASAPWGWPLKRYAYLNVYDFIEDPLDPPPTALSRRLDPADPEDIQPGEVAFEYGIGQDNVAELDVEPERPATHWHVLDEQGAYRVTRADIDSSARVGAFTQWWKSVITIQREQAGRVTAEDPAPSNVPPNLRPLIELAEAYVRAYGVPVKHFVLRLHPDDLQSTHYGHPEWEDYMVSRGLAAPGDGGDWYIGDIVLIRGKKGYREFSTLARIVQVTPRQDGSNGLVYFEVGFIPVAGGAPTRDTDNPLDIGDEPSAPGPDPDPPPDPPPPGEGDVDPPAGTLLFEDHFDGDALDTEAWQTYYGPGHAGNGLRRPSQIAVVGGQLVITAHWDGLNIISGGMAHRENYLYGTFIARVRTESDPTGQMSAECITWPESEDWPHDGELDWYETGIEVDRTPFFSYLHWQDGTTPGDQTQIVHAGASATDWHIMRMDWTPTEIRIYRDGVLIGTETDDAKIPNTPMHVTLQCDALSNYPLTQDVRFFVDYVQVYAI